jgi:hypothetical protein
MLDKRLALMEKLDRPSGAIHQALEFGRVRNWISRTKRQGGRKRIRYDSRFRRCSNNVQSLFHEVTQC